MVLSFARHLLTVSFVLIYCHSSFASDATTASLISNHISYLSAHDAYDYIDIYRSTFHACAKAHSNILGPSEKKSCLKQSLAEVRKASEPKFSDRISQRRVNDLRRKGLISPYSLYPDKNLPTFGVVGCSLAVGAMAAEHIEPHVFKLLYQGAFSYLIAGQDTTREEIPIGLPANEFPTSRVIRIFNTPEEKKGKIARFFENKGSEFIDCEECSFPYTVARKLQIPAKNIFFAGQSGKRVDTLKTQLERLSLPLGHLPNKTIVSYTANDICHNENLAIDPEDKYKEYYHKMVSLFDEALREATPADQGSEIFVVAATDFAALLDNESVLSRKVNHYWPGGPNKKGATCRDVREQSLGGTDKLANMCPLILNTHPDDSARIEHIKELHQAIVRAQSDAVAYLSKHKKYKNIKLYFSDSNLGIDFNAEDISTDCFHPSTKGHDKISQAVFEDILRLTKR